MKNASLTFACAFVFAMLSLSSRAMAQDADAKLITSPEFRLSPEATTAGIDGNLKVDITVDKSGNVKEAQVLAGPAWPCGSNPKKEIDKVQDAVKQNVLGMRFSPAMKDGKPHESEMVMTFVVGAAYRQMVKEREAEAAARAGNVPRIVESGVMNGRALRLPKPEYPSMTPVLRMSGAVPVQILIDEQGKVILAGAVGGLHVFQSNARNAACGALFSPTSIKGQPVKVSGVITYNFVP
jgi:outer membrane biosynthesis protein TonB